MNAITAAAYMEKAERDLSAARLLLASENSGKACSCAYYAMYDAAHAALIATGHETPETLIKTHHSLIAEFGKKLVVGGLIEAEHGRAFNRMEDIRLLADYSTDEPPLENAKWAVKHAEAFVDAVRTLSALPEQERSTSRGGGMANFVSEATKKEIKDQPSSPHRGRKR